MILGYALLGLLVAILGNWASDDLRRFGVRNQTWVSESGARPGLTLPRWIAGARSKASTLAAIVEVGSTVLYVVLGLRLGPTTDFAIAAAVCAYLLLIALIDLKHRLVLNVLVYPAIVVALAAHALSGSITNTIMGGIFAFVIFYGTAIMKPGNLGGGDVKLAALIGLAFGFPNVLWVLIVGAGSAAVVAVYFLMTSGHAIRSIPYAPFLCLGALVALFYNPFLTLIVFRQ